MPLFRIPWTFAHLPAFIPFGFLTGDTLGWLILGALCAILVLFGAIYLTIRFRRNSEPEPESVPLPESDSESISGPVSGSVPAPESVPLPESDSESVTAPESVPLPESVTGSILESVSESVSRLVSELVPLPGSVLEPLLGPVSEVVWGPVSEPEQESPNRPKLYIGSINYGVEFEFVFAFMEVELDLGPDIIKKNIPYVEREAKFTRVIARLPDHPYNSWGVKSYITGEVQPYDKQPQAILKRKLNAQYPEIPIEVYGTIEGSQKTPAYLGQYKNWITTVDHTVCGVGSPNIPLWLPHRPSSTFHGDDWDSYGIELVTPIFNGAVPDNMRQIGKIIKGVGGPETFGYDAFITNQCGLHVHVDSPKDLKVLIELAVILLVYEEEISRLHPPCRRPGHPASMRQLDSNRLWLLKRDDPVFVQGDASRDGTWLNTDCSTKALSQKYSVQAIRNRMRLNTTKEQLAQKMCAPKTHLNPHGNRNRLVNFVNMARGEGYAETIEFRQARGSLSRTETFHWTNFCIGLVKLAEFYAQNPDRFPAKTWEDLHVPPGTKVKDLPIFRLMQDMSLDEKAPKFWAKKIVRYLRSKLGDRDNRTDNEPPPVDEPFQPEKSDNGESNVHEEPNYPEPAQPIPDQGALDLGAQGGSTPALQPTDASHEGETGTPSDGNEAGNRNKGKQRMEPQQALVRHRNSPCLPVDGIASHISIIERRPAGAIAAEPMAQDLESWYVENFKTSDWRKILPPKRAGPEPRFKSCGIYALIDSFRAQYPNFGFSQVQPQTLLSLLDDIYPLWELKVLSEDHMQALVSRFTKGEFNLVVNHSSCGKASIARRVGDHDAQGFYAKNLFMRYICGHSSGRWEGMRKAGPSQPATPSAESAESA